LPIRYLYRDPEEAKRGFALMLKEVETEFIAILFDDDWWGPDHIANGARYCREERGLGCYFSAYFMVEGERSRLSTHATTEFWFGAGFPSLEADWKLNLADAVSACLVDPPCTYSSMIAPLDKLKNAYRTQLKIGNPYDSDRLMTLELAKQGLLVVNPIPEVFVRFHPGQDKNRFSRDDVKRFKSMSIMHLLSICHEHNIDVGREFDARITHADKRMASQICQRIVEDSEDFLKDGRIDSLVLRKYWMQVCAARREGRVRKVAKQLVASTRRGWRAMIPK